MGGNILSLLDGDGEACAVCGVDLHAPENTKIPVYPSFGEVKEIPDVIIDFSSPAALQGEMDWAVKHGVPVVLAATGLPEGASVFRLWCFSIISISNFSPKTSAASRTSLTC